MKPTKHFSFILVLSLFLAFSSQAQQPQQKEDDFDQGYRFLYYKVLDSAYYLLDNYINNGKDSLKKGKAYLYIGEMLWNNGDLYGAQESLAGSLKTFNQTESAHREHLAYTYSVLGNISLDLKQYHEAIDFYNKGLPYASADFMPELMNGKATTYQKMKRYEDAIRVYDSLLRLPPSSYALLARITDNKAYTSWLANPGYDALPELHAAVKMRQDSGHNWGLNASYAHLSDYYATTNRDSAIWYAHNMLQVARGFESPGDILEAMDKLVTLSPAADTKLKWYTDYKFLRDSLQLSRDTTRNRFALIRYEVQKNKAENLQLQQTVTTQRLWTYGVIALATLSLGWLYTWYARRQKKIKKQSEERIRVSQLKTSQKVHDVVANGLYTIMNELEHRPGIDREPLMNKIEGLYEQSRNISYEEVASADSSRYDAQVHALLTSFANEKTKVIVVGNQASFWKKISPLQKQELEMILQELMINMKKHSGAGNVAIIFKTDKNNALIQYKDDGVGLDPSYPFGNGLQSTVNRINSMKGAINFGKSEKGGVAIDISLPLEPHSI